MSRCLGHPDSASEPPVGFAARLFNGARELRGQKRVNNELRLHSPVRSWIVKLIFEGSKLACARIVLRPKAQRVALKFTHFQIVIREVPAIIFDDLLNNPSPVMNGDGNAVLQGQFILQSGAVLGLRELARYADDPLIGPTWRGEPLHVAADFFFPLGLGAECEGPTFATVIGVADVGECLDLVGDGKGF
jgi:hypothetical protein